jgi:hypothetical protein
MAFDDMFKHYSPEIKGDLETYLVEQEKGGADNLFFGTKYFFVLKDKDLLIPGQSHIRVNRSPAPDLSYYVNSAFLLESTGSGECNMSLISAKKGIYSPDRALKNRIWSVSGLNLQLC